MSAGTNKTRERVLCGVVWPAVSHCRTGYWPAAGGYPAQPTADACNLTATYVTIYDEASEGLPVTGHGGL